MPKHNAFQRLAFEPLAEDVRPGNEEPAIGGLQRRNGDALVRQQRRPCPIRAEPRPARAAQRQQRGVRPDRPLALGCCKTQGAVRVPSGPIVTQGEAHAPRIQPTQPSPQQRRGLERLRKHPPARADKSRLPKSFAPRPQSLRRKRLDRRAQARLRGTIARQKYIQRLAMGEIEAATPGHQEFARDGWHAIIHRHPHAGTRDGFRRHQPGRTGADNRNLRLAHGFSGGSLMPALFAACAINPANWSNASRG